MARAAAEIATDDQVRDVLASTPLGRVNPDYGEPGTDTNCGQVALTADAMLADLVAGREVFPVSAVRNRHWSTVLLIAVFSEMFRTAPVRLRARSWGAARHELSGILAESGSRALFWAMPEHGRGHVVNAANIEGVLHLLDGQNGRPAQFSEDYTIFFSLRTDRSEPRRVPYCFREDGTLDPYWKQIPVLVRYHEFWGISFLVSPSVCRALPLLERLVLQALSTQRRGMDAVTRAGVPLQRSLTSHLIPAQRSAPASPASTLQPGRCP